jgi:phosphoribosylanthranilate isomerase
MLIKVCGIKYKENLSDVVSAEPDMLGFIFYKPSSRYAGNDLSPSDMDKIPLRIIKTGVFVNEDETAILSRVKEYRLDMVQLHGDESIELCKRLKQKGLIIIKAFRIDDGFDFSRTEEYAPVSACFLFDTNGKEFGGNGEIFNWSELDRYKGNTPFLLSGGIGPEMSEELGSFHHNMFVGIDLNSRFEVEPGRKETEKVLEFIKKIRK